MTTSHVKVLTMPAADQDRAKQFYAGTLGFEVQADQMFGDNRWLQVAPRSAATVQDPDGNGMVLQDAATWA